MADPMLIQKQIKDNTEDLHNFVRDLKIWEEDMKRKDRQLSKEKSDEEMAPPVRRSKVSSQSTAAKQEPNENKKKRIQSYDYKAWDTFDVDKACEAVDNPDPAGAVEEDVEEAAKDDLRYQKEKASYEKELGNRHVKASKWDEAIEAYTRAIAAYSRDPIFFANRALCYLKKKKYAAVEKDCTESLKLDVTYVKAFLRRAAAREALGRLEDARHDLRQVLQLEPNNTQAERDLARLTSLEAEKKKTTKAACAVDKTMSGLVSSKNNSSTGPQLSPKDDKNSLNKSILQSGVVKAAETIKYKRSDGPHWEPCSGLVEPIVKPPHLRSQKSLKRIEIVDVGSNTPQHVCKRKQMDASKELPENKPSPSAIVEVVPSGGKHTSTLTTSAAESVADVPPPPKNSVQFHNSWSSIKADQEMCYKFLMQVSGEQLAGIFKESLESRMFSSLVELLASEFTRRGECVAAYLRGLSCVKRFSTLVMFMSPSDKSNLLRLFDYCKSTKECTDEEITQLKILYEMT